MFSQTSKFGKNGNRVGHKGSDPSKIQSSMGGGTTTDKLCDLGDFGSNLVSGKNGQMIGFGTNNQNSFKS